MINEIKYQAWHKEQKKMYRVVALYLGKREKSATVQEDEDSIFSLCTYSLEEVELRQYIGLPDKHDKDIYKGDLIKYDFEGQERIDEVAYVLGCYIPDIWRYQAPEVIGNIWENPELLKGREREHA